MSVSLGEKRVRLISHACGDEWQRCADITWPRWQKIALAAGWLWEFERIEKRKGQKRANWQWGKLYALAQSNIDVDMTIWVDVDLLPTPHAVNFDTDEYCEGEILGIPINDPCPHAVQAMSGIMRISGPQGSMLINEALLRIGYHNGPWPEERAIMDAAGGEPLGLRTKRSDPWQWKRRTRALSTDWVRPTNRIDAGALCVHSYAPPKEKSGDLWAAARVIDGMDWSNLTTQRSKLTRPSLRLESDVSSPTTVAENHHSDNR